MNGAGRSFDAIPSPYKFEDMAFSKLKSVHFKQLNQSFDDSDFVSWGIVDNDGRLTNAGALLADDSPICLRIAQYRITQFVLGDHLVYN